MNSELEKIITDIIPQQGLQTLLDGDGFDGIEEMVYEIAGHDSIEKYYSEIEFPEMLFNICQTMMKCLLKNNPKEKILFAFNPVTANISYIEDRPIPDNFFEQFVKIIFESWKQEKK